MNIDEIYDSFEGDPGPIESILNTYSNASVLEVKGLGFIGNLHFESSFAAYKIGAQWPHVLYYGTGDSDDNLVGESTSNAGHPANRITAIFRMGIENLTISYALNYLGTFNAPRDPGGSTTEFAAWMGHDVTASWQRALGVSNLNMNAGVLNFTDEAPSMPPDRDYEASKDIMRHLYPLSGVVPFVSFKYSFSNQ